MRKPDTTPFFAALALILPAALLPQTANAQVEAPEAPMTCTAETEAVIAPGEVALSATFVLSEDIGEITGVASPESGVVVANPADLPRVDMANPEETPAPIEMSAEEENTVTVWLNSTNAQEGEHEFWLVSDGARCASTITVEGGSA